MSKHLRNTFSVVLFLSLIVVGAAAQNTGKALYLDPSQPINVRVDDLIKRMTLEQKASQLVNQARAIPDLQVPAYDWWSEALARRGQCRNRDRLSRAGRTRGDI